MPIFRCTKCGVVDNTAISGYWARSMDKLPALCSECNPDIGKWHDAFTKSTPEECGYVKGPDGFLYSPDDSYLKRQLAEKAKRDSSERR